MHHEFVSLQILEEYKSVKDLVSSSGRDGTNAIQTNAESVAPNALLEVGDSKNRGDVPILFVSVLKLVKLNIYWKNVVFYDLL